MVKINDNQLIELPREIGGLQNLEHIWISNNRLTKLPASFLNLNNLKAIYLRKNPELVFNDEIGKIPKNIQSLDLSENSFAVIPPGLRDFRNLEYLYLSKNRISELPQWIDKLSNLQLIDLSENNFSQAERIKSKKLLPKCKIMF